MAKTADIERVILLVEIALTIGKNLVLILFAIVAITIALAGYNFATGNLAWGHSAFVVWPCWPGFPCADTPDA